MIFQKPSLLSIERVGRRDNFHAWSLAQKQKIIDTNVADLTGSQAAITSQNTAQARRWFAAHISEYFYCLLDPFPAFGKAMINNEQAYLDT
jgi:hypothetical protein